MAGALKLLKYADVGVQLLFYAGVSGYALVGSILAGTPDVVLSGAIYLAFAVMGPYQALSSLVHAFLPKHLQLLRHRKVYGWCVVVYFALQLFFYLLFQDRYISHHIGKLVFHAALPLFAYYLWISMRETMLLRAQPA
jgi:hypothetical protein